MIYSVCVIGAGRIGQIHAENLATLGSCTLRYVVDPNEAAARELAARTGGTVTGLDHALGDKVVCGVIITSPANTHADLIVAAARAGKAVFCEKPIDLSITKTMQCLGIAEELQTPLLIGFNRRFDPHFQALKSSLDAGTLGHLEMLQITSRDPSPPPAEYIKSSGGLFKDMMIHDMDMARWLLGEEPVAVSATASCLIDPAIADEGDIDSAFVTLKTAGGRLCNISNSRRACYGYDQRIEAHCSGGMASVDNLLTNQFRMNTGEGMQRNKLQYFFLDRYAAAYKAEARHFVDILSGAAQPLITGNDGLKALVLAEAAELSLKEKRVIKL